MVNVSVSPHIRSRLSTSTVMGDVAIALLPALLFGVFVFGLRALLIILVSVATCLLSEYLYQRLMKFPVTVGDGSALVTGLILAMNLPASVPFWVPMMGGVFAILFVKQFFGGVGQNIMNPALAARCFLLISFPALLGGSMPAVGNMVGADMWQNFVRRMSALPPDATTMATPLQVLKNGESIDLLQAFLGLHSGCIGETSSLAILLGFGYMLFRGVVSPRIPSLMVLFTVGFVALFRVAQGEPVTVNYILGQVCTGGLLAGAVFMATDYTTSPITPWGQVLYCLLLGLLTAALRVFGSSAEGVSYAIVIGNTLVPLMEKVTMPRPFGKRGAAR
ncbi:MAG: RnfABCDGE type electron transport complex subunit D [Clostridia bacterium]|nr:RnfABCDGE type electron transport complex subunit D [Clostridia bacterium]